MKNNSPVEIKEIQLTPEKIDAFLSDLKARGRSAATLRKYRMDLLTFYRRLPEGKMVNVDTLLNWQKDLTERGFALRTVNARISAINSFYIYIGREDWLVSPYAVPPSEEDTDLSRADYLQLLLQARETKQEELYYLIKLFACIDISLQDLGNVTVEAIREGAIPQSVRNKPQSLRLPATLQKELQSYALHAGIESGPIFADLLEESGIRAYINFEIGQLCAGCEIPESKGTIRALKNLRQATYSDIRAHVATLTEQAYDRMLESELLIAGWDNPEEGDEAL